jgi:arginyl-tRNA synthetase
MRAYDFDRSLYVVDRGQSLHFKQLFSVLARMGFDWVARCAHVPFGVVRIGGKKTRSRAGSIVLLKEVLREATDRSRDRVREENPEMDAAALERTARAVGIGAVVFANLVTQREKDVDFEWEDVLSTKGDSGPYVQYAHARCSSVLAKAGVSSVTELAESDPAALTSDLEWALARALTDYADAVVKATDSNEPHFVSRYLLDLCATYSRWYTSGNTDTTLRVLVDDPAARQARLALLASTRRVLADGLGLLGLEAPDAM